MAVAVGPRDSGTTWLSALTLSFDSSELSLPHPYRVTSNFLPNCPSLMDNSDNNNVCIYRYIHTVLVFLLLPSEESAKNGRIRLELYSGAGPGDRETSELTDAFGRRPQLSSY